MKEINQRNENKLLVQCNCGSYHFIMFDFYDWDDYKEFNVSMIDQPDSLWFRIKKALKYIFSGGDLYYMDVSLTTEDLDELIELINKYKTLNNKEEN